MGLLDKCPTEQQFHPSTKAIWMIVITLGKAFLEYSPLSELLAPRPVAVHGTVCRRETGVVQAPSTKGSAQPSAKPKVTCGPWEDKPEPWNKLPSSQFPIQMAVMKQGNMMCLSLSAMMKPCWWIMLIPSCQNPNSSWVHYSSLALQRARFSFRCLILLKDLRNAQGHKLFFS